MMLKEKYDLVDELLTVLEKLIAIYTELNIMNDAKQRYLATDDIKELQTIIQKENEMASVIATLEDRRVLLQNTIDSSHTSVGQLIVLLDEPRKSRVLSLSQELRRLVDSLRVLQEANSIAIHHLFNFIKHERNVLYRVSTVPDYGEINSFSENKSMINKII